MNKSELGCNMIESVMDVWSYFWKEDFDNPKSLLHLESKRRFLYFRTCSLISHDRLVTEDERGLRYEE